MLFVSGVRYVTLTHNGGPRWAESALRRDGTIVHDAAKGGGTGLTKFGHAMVGEFNRLGMMVDLSHVHAATMRAALAASRAPCVFSHSGARGVCPHPRNVPDDVLPLVRANGGVVCVTFVSSFVSGPIRNTPGGKATLSQVADHIAHIRDKIGIDHVGIGGDYDGCTNLPVGLEDTGCYCGLTAELLRRGFGEDGVAKVLGGNVLRVWEAVEDVARAMVAEGALPSVARIEDLDTPVDE